MTVAARPPAPRVMGIVNVTPDSFSDGGHHATTDRAVAHGHVLLAQGADILASLRRPTRASLSRALGSFILNRVDVNTELADIVVPSLFVASDDRGDWSPADAAAAAARTPGARVATVTGARTLVPLEQPAAVAALLRTFWDETGAPAGGSPASTDES